MTREAVSEIGRGLLAHLHLSASEAAVMVEPRPSKRLVVLIYDEAASRRVPRLTEWRGYKVHFVKDLVHGPH